MTDNETIEQARQAIEDRDFFNVRKSLKALFQKRDELSDENFFAIHFIEGQRCFLERSLEKAEAYLRKALQRSQECSGIAAQEIIECETLLLDCLSLQQKQLEFSAVADHLVERRLAVIPKAGLSEEGVDDMISLATDLVSYTRKIRTSNIDLVLKFCHISASLLEDAAVFTPSPQKDALLQRSLRIHNFRERLDLAAGASPDEPTERLFDIELPPM